MAQRLARWWLWFLINVIGIAVFFVFAVPTWVDPEDPPGSNGGSAFVWGVGALPIFLLFLAAHIPMSFFGLRDAFVRKNWRGTIFLAVTISCWAAAFLFDNLHHGI